jgi:membrane associated rhomboid family serine protease
MPADLKDVLLLALANPATIAVAYWLGRRADQRPKIVVAAFIAGIAGVVFAWLLMLTGMVEPKVRLLSGIFVAAGVSGLVWAWLGFTIRKWKADHQ